MTSDAEVKTQSARGAEEYSRRGSDQRNRQSGPEQPSSQHGNIGQRTDGTAGQGAIIGGILARMIADKRDRLREVKECIKWYQDEEQKRLAELADLEQFAEELLGDEDLLEQSNPDV